MNTLKNQPLYFCGCCKQKLPLAAFYINSKTQSPSNYCKECRKAVSRVKYDSDKGSQIGPKARHYPVITQIEDPETRKVLLLHALQVVAESITRKRERDKKNEYESVLENHKQPYAKN